MWVESASPTPAKTLKALTIVSYLAPNWFWFYEAIAASISQALQREISLIQSFHDPLHDPLLQQDQVDLAFMCGLPFIRQHQRVPQQFQAVVAPVMASPRYHNQPIYFADVIVNAASAITTFEQLAGSTLCYNDVGSNSGYNLLRYRLLQSHLHSFFSKTIPSGSHQGSIQWVADGLASCAAINSTVLEQALRNDPHLAQRLRVVETLGPCPMPPLVAAQQLGSELIAQLRSLLLAPNLMLQEAMEQAHVQGFAIVTADEYEILAEMYSATLRRGHQF
ncbi:phosphate/phosphite/phosphonate ABC transporter substrate-binding protein [Stenomitos frigidus]|uniref:Phosphate ABC transporter substrate-binding protein n=1 Tax=Stenomitos frigidus ULC18 TaxID=2107698 RepID=A0A2T1DZT1_9CYAN|nr:PhnD/SsuA/transferrin family substrate-binding protein [Stenomitos frigidus]PSB26000.1 phosphate ABC transporter substrate-binding protein [Stenomitos frigidus ULC18]